MPTPPGPRAIAVRAPATSANLGPGFDCLGLALDLWNEVVAVPAAGHPGDARASPRDHPPAAAPADDNLIARAARRLFEHVRAPFPGFRLECTNRIPFSRGLGSSAAAIVSGLLLANHALGDPLRAPELLALATELEGHPDNVAPCLLGGVRAVALGRSGGVLQAAVPVPRPLVAAIFVPEVHVPTELARAALPASVSLEDALFNVSRAALLVAALGAGDYRLLRDATDDRLHQPYRAALFPAMAPLIEAALAAGALGAYSSGAGSSILALCPGPAEAEPVCAAFRCTAARAAVPGSTLVVGLSRRGAHLVDHD
jgi:homoserine kinase